MLLRVPGQTSVERPYIKFDGDGQERIDFAFTPSHPSKYPTSIYYARYRHGRFVRADGSRIAGMRDLPLLPRQADTVYDRTAGCRCEREIERWSTPDHGASWTHRAVTSGSAVDNLRPVAPRAHTRRGVQLLWMRGDYPHYLHSRTRIAVSVER